MRALGHFHESSPQAGTLASPADKAFLEFCEHEGYDCRRPRSPMTRLRATAHAPGFRTTRHVLCAKVRRLTPRRGRTEPSMRWGSTSRKRRRRYFQLERFGCPHRLPISGSDDSHHRSCSEPADIDLSPTTASARACERRCARKPSRAKCSDGRPTGTRSANRRRLELIAEEAVVVRYIYRLYLQRRDGDPAHRAAPERRGTEDAPAGGQLEHGEHPRHPAEPRVPGHVLALRGEGAGQPHRSSSPQDDFKTVQDPLNARRTSYTPRVASQFLLSGHRALRVLREQAHRRQP